MDESLVGVSPCCSMATSQMRLSYFVSIVRDLILSGRWNFMSQGDTASSSSQSHPAIRWQRSNLNLICTSFSELTSQQLIFMSTIHFMSINLFCLSSEIIFTTKRHGQTFSWILNRGTLMCQLFYGSTSKVIYLRCCLGLLLNHLELFLCWEECFFCRNSISLWLEDKQWLEKTCWEKRKGFCISVWDKSP